MIPLIIIGAVVAVLGAMMLTIALSSNSAQPAPTAEPPVEAAQPPAQTAAGVKEAPPAEPAAPAAEVKPEIKPEAEVPPEPEASPTVAIAERHDEMTSAPTALQLKTAEIIAGQIDRLQAEYLRIADEREHLAQELLTSWLIEKFEDSNGRLKVATKREAQDLRQRLVKVSAEFERVEFRLSSLQNLQTRLNEPRVTHQIEDLVNAVKQLARAR
jgi:type IV secretory pathway VirB10-like protein